MRITFFGSYRPSEQPRTRVLMEGFRAAGDEVAECNVPLPLDTAARVRMLRQPWRAPTLVFLLATVWPRLWIRARSMPAPDAVVVPYLGHLDVHLARRLWPTTPVALDYLISGADTAIDRGTRSGWLLHMLRRIDEAAVAAADVPFVDTHEHLERLPAGDRDRGLVVPVGAPTGAFREPRPGGTGPLRVIFFGSFAPLQGATVIAEAIARLAGAPIRFTVVGSGQDRPEAARLASPNAAVEWIDWLEPDALTERVARCDVCLGIFGSGPKALRVVPHKVFHGAAAGCAIVTSDTPPQRRALGKAAVYVPPGDAAALAGALRELAGDRTRVARLRAMSAARAQESFAPEAVTRPLRERLTTVARRSALRDG